MGCSTVAHPSPSDWTWGSPAREGGALASAVAVSSFYDWAIAAALVS